MKRFRFSLQSVHDLRETLRDEAERQLALAMAEAAAASKRITEAEELIVRTGADFAARLQSGKVLDPQEAALCADYLSVLVRRIKDEKIRLKDLESACEFKRLAVVEAARAAEATAKLRDRQQSRHTAEAARHEQNMLDEIATLSSARRVAES